MLQKYQMLPEILHHFSTTHLHGMQLTLRHVVRFATQSAIHYASSELPRNTMRRSFVDPISGIREKPGTVPA